MALAIAATEITTAPTIAKLAGFGSLPIYCRKKLPAIPDARIIEVVTGEPIDTAAAIKKSIRYSGQGYYQMLLVLTPQSNT